MRALDVLQPPGDVVVPRHPGSNRLGVRVADQLLSAAAGEAEDGCSLKAWGDKTHERLGRQIAARITAKLDEKYQPLPHREPELQ